MMGAVQSEQEYRAVKSYKAKAEEMAEAEARRADLRKKTAVLVAHARGMVKNPVKKVVFRLDKRRILCYNREKPRKGGK